MRRSIAASVLLALLVQTGNAAPVRATTLRLPHPLQTGETAWLEVHVGAIDRGEEINVATDSGRQLGTISPFAVRSGRDAGTYTLPVPEAAIRNARVSVRLSISQSSAIPRGPTALEVPSVKLVISDAPH